MLLATLISDELILSRKIAYYIGLVVTVILAILFTIDYNYEHRWVNGWALYSNISMFVLSILVMLILRRKRRE